jgi:hypothetical protein
MKRIIKFIVLTICVTTLNMVNAQWSTRGVFSNRHGSGAQTTPLGINTWRSWGFGDFTA